MPQIIYQRRQSAVFPDDLVEDSLIVSVGQVSVQGTVFICPGLVIYLCRRVFSKDRDILLFQSFIQPYPVFPGQPVR